MKTKRTNPLRSDKKTGSSHAQRSRSGHRVLRGGATQPGRKTQSVVATPSLRKRLPNNTLQGKLPRNRDIQLTPNQKSQQVDAQPAFLPLLLLWGLFGGRKKNRAGQFGGGAGAGGWGGMGSGAGPGGWGGMGSGAGPGGWGGMGGASPWFQNPSAGGMGQMPVGPMTNQGMGGSWNAPATPWGGGGVPGTGMFGSGMGGPRFPTWF